MGVRIRYSACAVRTQVYLSSAWKNSTSATATWCVSSPWLARIQRSGAAPGAGADCRARSARAQVGVVAGRRCVAALAWRERAPQAFDRAREAFGRHRLEHVVERLGVERGERVLVVGGHEDDARQALDAARPLPGRSGRASGCRGTRCRAAARRSARRPRGRCGRWRRSRVRATAWPAGRAGSGRGGFRRRR